ncbi:MAG: GNAT family N-acetyltransferase [Pseudomonadota bacterium]
MSGPVDLRAMRREDADAVEALYAAAFEDEDLTPLLRGLADAPAAAAFVVTACDAVMGHVALTACGVSGSDAAVSLLGPLAVATDQRGRGYGRRLIEASLGAAQQAGAAAVFVYGDPAFYGRFGFAIDDAVTPPYGAPAMWAQGWSALWFGEGRALRGTLVVPPPWGDERLWLI